MRAAFVSLVVASFATAYSTTYIFSYVGFLAKDIGHLNSANEAGQLAGYLSGALYFGRSFTAPIWGYISDQYGRRPTLILSSLSSFIFPLLFGFCNDINLLILTRLCLGFFNGTIPVSRAALPEVVSQEDIAGAYGLMTSTWSIGRILGPAISGWAVSIPNQDNITETDLKIDANYFLPSFICSFVGLLGFLSVLLLLPETLKSLQETEDIENEEETTFLSKPKSKKERESLLQILCTRKFLSSMMIYSIFSFTVTYVNDVFPLWAISSKDKGGLTLGTSQIGTIFAVGGFAMLLSASGVYFLHKLGISIKTLSIVFMYFYALFIFLTPRLPLKLFPSNPFLGMILINCFREFIEVIVFNTIFIFLNNSVAPKNRGTAHGFSLGLASVTKMLGPVVGAPLFAWTISDVNNYSWIQYTFAFDFDCLIVIFCAILTMIALPSSINKEFEEKT